MFPDCMMGISSICRLDAPARVSRQFRRLERCGSPSDDSADGGAGPLLVVLDCQKGEGLLLQGVHEMEQYFVLDGILKRVVSNQEAKEMILPLHPRRRDRDRLRRLAPQHADAVQHRVRDEGSSASFVGMGGLHRVQPGLK